MIYTPVNDIIKIPKILLPSVSKLITDMSGENVNITPLIPRETDVCHPNKILKTNPANVKIREVV